MVQASESVSCAANSTGALSTPKRFAPANQVELIDDVEARARVMARLNSTRLAVALSFPEAFAGMLAARCPP